MGKLWYCLIDGKSLGPVNSNELKGLAESGTLRAVHYVRQDSVEDWTLAVQVRGLFPSSTGSSPQQPIAPPQQPRWAVRAGGREYGPYTDNQLRRYAADGFILSNHDVRLMAGTEWVKARRIKNLFPRQLAIKPSQQPSAVVAPKVRFTCPSCGKYLQCREALTGKSLPCPACRATVLVPTVADEIAISKSAVAVLADSPEIPRSVPEEPGVVQEPRTNGKGEQIGKWNLKDILGGLRLNVSTGQGPHESTKDSIMFYGPGKAIDLGFGPLLSPLVYATKRRLPAVLDASLIEIPLPTSKKALDPNPLPYWPTYHECTPHQRARYLEWLYQGRSDTSIEIGYVFLFFYGLERRILVDGQDHEVVIEELLRLLKTYTQSRSFINYSSALLWLTVYLSIDHRPISDELLLSVVRSTTRWKETISRYCLGYYCRRNVPLPLEVVYAIAEQDERSINSIVTRRHEDKFRELFAGRFEKAYPDGFTLRPGSRERKIDYLPGSATLLASKDSARELISRTIPDVLSARGQFSPLVAIWNECIEQLKDFDRVSRRAVSATLTGEMYESLPAELRMGDHPESAAWQRTITESVNEGGWPIMPVSRLAEIKGLAVRPTLTKKQSQSLLATADAMGFAIEPDARLSNRNYRWEEPIVVFRMEGDLPSEAQSKAYHSAAILLRLGLAIAQADGQLDEVELARIAEHIELEFNLGPRLAKRLDALTHLLAVERANEVSVARTLQKALSLEQRRLVGQFLLAIAAVDELVCPDERKVLRKAYRALGIPVEELDALLTSYDEPTRVNEQPQVPEDGAPPPPTLNLERIRAIHAETARVQILLHEVLSNVDVPPSDEVAGGVAESTILHGSPLSAVNPSANANSLNPSDRLRDNSQLDQTPVAPLARLPERYRQFCETVISRDRWKSEEIANLARDQGLMLNAALEVLNEWSTDVYGDWLTEEVDAELIVHKHVIGVTLNA